MSVLPVQASFEELVQDCFLALSGRGLMLSALDATVVSEWARQNVPVEVVIRGLQRAQARLLYDARPGDRPIRSLRACRRDVDAEIRQYRERSAGAALEGEPAVQQAPQPPRKLSQALRSLAERRPDLAPAVDKLCTDLSAIPLEKRDPWVLLTLLRALPFAERQQVAKGARESLGEEPSGSWHARKVSRRFHRLLAVKRALQLPAFW